MNVIEKLKDNFFSAKGHRNKIRKDRNRLDNNWKNIQKDFRIAEGNQSNLEKKFELASQQRVAGIIDQNTYDQVKKSIHDNEALIARLTHEEPTCERAFTTLSDQLLIANQTVEKARRTLLLAISQEHADKACRAAMNDIQNAFAAYAVTTNGFVDWNKAFRSYLGEIFNTVNMKEIGTRVSTLRNQYPIE